MSKPTLVADWSDRQLRFKDGLLFNGPNQVGTISSSSIGSDVVAHTAFFRDATIDFMEYTKECPQISVAKSGNNRTLDTPSCFCIGQARNTGASYSVEIQHGPTVTQGRIYFRLNPDLPSDLPSDLPPLSL